MDPNRKSDNTRRTTIGKINSNESKKITGLYQLMGTFFRTDKESVLSTILNKWFNERVIYKNKMKKML